MANCGCGITELIVTSIFYSLLDLVICCSKIVLLDTWTLLKVAESEDLELFCYGK
jgi:hypothetical protein